ncbi:hypothetical protein QZH41_017538 [Actinostola sp. cb2023]|nr:hypothetical protein QZH41_017538 [Actinostola sp. cb2023]
MATIATKIPLYKVVLVGEVGVGKSSVYTRFQKGYFNPLGTPTIGVDSFTEELVVDGKHCKLNIWDTAGLERTGSLTSHYYHAAHVIVFMYAVDDMTSLNMILHWDDDADRYADLAVKFLVANKIDLDKDDWEILEEKAQTFMDNNNFVDKFSISAKTGEGVQEMFQSISKHLLQENMPASEPITDVFHPSPEDSLDLRRSNKSSSGCFCYGGD